MSIEAEQVSVEDDIDYRNQQLIDQVPEYRLVQLMHQRPLVLL